MAGVAANSCTISRFGDGQNTRPGLHILNAAA
jgi:hypothetical protein